MLINQQINGNNHNACGKKYSFLNDKKPKQTTRKKKKATIQRNNEKKKTREKTLNEQVVVAQRGWQAVKRWGVVARP